MKSNTDFILSPIVKILEHATQAASGMGDGIETYPLSDYLMQSVFLQMTGFQEQKFKSVHWEIASFDYDYRYEVLSGKKNKIGECSTYEIKNMLLNDLFAEIKKENSSVSTNNYKERLLNETRAELSQIFKNSNILYMNERQYNLFKSDKRFIVDNLFEENSDKFELFKGNKKDSKISKDSLRYEYEEKLYRHRNRCAHNLLSYQQNLPDFKTLLDDEYENNYFVWFAMLILIDKITIELFLKFIEMSE